MSQVLDRVLTAARQLGASDVHLKAGLPPIFRIKGDLRTVRDVPALTREAIAQFAVHMMNERQRAEFEQHLDIDLAYGTPDGVRYRVNLFQQRGSVGMVMRLIPPEVPPFANLNLAPAVLDLANNARGVVLVTGATGSGKSTTLAAMIDYINKNRSDHIITIEDPVEFVHKNIKGIVNQREVGQHTKSFKSALRAALREDPDIVLVGEMRDLETIAAALTIAETGHLALATLHTNSAAESINRIIDVFPSNQQSQVRAQLAFVLEGVITQTLLPKSRGRGRVMACEIMVATPAIRALIRDDKIHQIYSSMQSGKKHGMQTMNDALYQLYTNREVTQEECERVSHDPKEFLRMIGVTPMEEQDFATNGHAGDKGRAAGASRR